jgi:hypothetical protein
LTKHKAKVNVVGGLAAIAEQASRKRRAEEEIERPLYARCENCEQRYDVNETILGASRSCAYHPGMSCTCLPGFDAT